MEFPDKGRDGEYPDPFSAHEGAYDEAALAAAADRSAAAHEDPPQLELGDDDVRLPWLEGDDEAFEGGSGSGMGQGLLLALLGIVALGLIAGTVFLLTRGKSDADLVADGGTIAAPKEPYKERPENPGGEVVAGTGDTSFAVAEGESRPPQIDRAGEAPAAVQPATPEATASAAPAPAEPAASGVGVQVGAYASRELAEAGWNTLRSQYEGLSGVNHRIIQGKADIGTVFRLQAVPGDLAAARALCSGMKSAGLSCQVKK